MPQIRTEVVHSNRALHVKEKVVVEDAVIKCRSRGEATNSKGYFPPLDWKCEGDNLWIGRIYDQIVITCECFSDELNCESGYVAQGSCFLEYKTKFKNVWFAILYVIGFLGLIMALPMIFCLLPKLMADTFLRRMCRCRQSRSPDETPESTPEHEPLQQVSSPI